MHIIQKSATNASRAHRRQKNIDAMVTRSGEARVSAAKQAIKIAPSMVDALKKICADGIIVDPSFGPIVVECVQAPLEG